MDRRTARQACALILTALILNACYDEEDNDAGSASAQGGGFSPSAPRISGSPSTIVAVSESFAFTPAAVDADGDKLEFRIAQLPTWLTFNTSNGSLRGTPGAADVGTYRGISISVSDGRNTAILAPFDIEVVAVGFRTATVSWLTPTQNEDGSQLIDLAGFHIHYGRQQGSYTKTVRVHNPGVTSYVVQGLVPGAYYFVLAAYNRDNVRSETSNEMSIVIR